MAQLCEFAIDSTPSPEGGLHFHEPKAHIFLGSDGDDE
jgi:hypothetical protein